MNPERWKRIDAIFSAVLEHPEKERASFLARACEGDEELRTHIQRLLWAHEEASSFLEKPPSDAPSTIFDLQRSMSAGQTSLPEEKTQPTPSSQPQGQPFGRALAMGRYIVLNKLGGGGMGVVYAAYDPELDRKVALKLLRTESAEEANAQEARARLLREAQAMARLSHPNVIAVHDVGTLDKQVFIAMEFVDGRTLTRWLKENKRTARQVLEVFVQAAKGLAAAHAAGLVHRDFKPDNVLVANDGRVKVLDFGLARAAEELEGLAPTQPAQLQVLSPSTPRALQTPLTRSGAFMGTPAYMSPEQLSRNATDARTDQFSFCVALYEALYGGRPFEGTTVEDLAQQVSIGKIKEAEKRSRVPGRVRQALRRGLRPHPDQRYPSMAPLLDELSRDPRVARRRAVAAASAAVVLGMVAIGYRAVAYRQSQVCKGAERKLAGVWDEDRRRAVAAAFMATAKPYAGDAVRGVQQALDSYAQGWVAMHTDACEATRLRGDQSEELLDLRMQCLAERRQELNSLAEIFTRQDPSVVENAVQAAVGLTSLNGCANIAALKAPLGAPGDAPTRARVQQHRNTLAEIKALRDTGKYAPALEMARRLAPEARQTRYKPLEAEALLMLGDLLEKTSQRKEAEEVLHDAADTAERARHAEVKARAWTLLGYLVGYRESRMEEGLHLARQAAAAVELLDYPPELDSELQRTFGVIYSHQARYEEALSHLKQALEIRQRDSGPEHPEVAKFLTSIGNALIESGHYAESLPYLQKAVELSERALGSEHPLVADALANMGNLLRREGKFDAALHAHQKALAIREKVFGPDHLRVATTLMNVGSVFRAQGRFAEALDFQQRALKLQEKALGPNNAELVSVLTNLGNVSRDLGNSEATLAYYQRALSIAEKAFGPQHPKVAVLLNNLGSAMHAEDNFQSALAYFRRALAIREKTLGGEHPEVATTLLNLGLTLRDQNKKGNFEIALGYLRRALAIREKASGHGSAGVADVLGELGLLVRGREPRQGLAYLEEALAIQEKTLPADSALLAVTLMRIGRTHLDLKQPLAAKGVLERAAKQLESSQRDPVNLAWARFLLARALWEAGSDRERAVSLAQQARFGLIKAGKAKSKMLREVEGWLTARAKTQAGLDRVGPEFLAQCAATPGGDASLLTRAPAVLT